MEIIVSDLTKLGRKSQYSSPPNALLSAAQHINFAEADSKLYFSLLLLEKYFPLSRKIEPYLKNQSPPFYSGNGRITLWNKGIKPFFSHTTCDLAQYLRTIMLR